MKVVAIQLKDKELANMVNGFNYVQIYTLIL